MEISAGLSYAFGANAMSRTILEIEVGELTTVDDVLRQLAQRYEAFKKVAFDAESQEFKNQIFVVLNGRLLQTPRELGARLRNGDNLNLIPPYTGG